MSTARYAHRAPSARRTPLSAKDALPGSLVKLVRPRVKCVQSILSLLKVAASAFVANQGGTAGKVRFIVRFATMMPHSRNLVELSTLTVSLLAATSVKRDLFTLVASPLLRVSSRTWEVESRAMLERNV